MFAAKSFVHRQIWLVTNESTLVIRGELIEYRKQECEWIFRSFEDSFVTFAVVRLHSIQR